MTPQMLEAPVLDPVYEAVLDGFLADRPASETHDWCDLTPDIEPPSGLDRFGMATVRIY